MPTVMVLACNPSTRKAEALRYITTSWLKRKKKIVSAFQINMEVYLIVFFIIGSEDSIKIYTC